MKSSAQIPLSILTSLLLTSFISVSAPAGFIYSETEVPKYTLPDPLVSQNGSVVTSAKQWTSFRRNEILELFQQEVYGQRMAKPDKITFELTTSQDDVMAGKAIRKQITITFKSGTQSHAMHVLLYLPASAKNRAPVFLGCNFSGNHTIHTDPNIELPTSWMRKKKDHRASENDRGRSSSRWPVETILGRGYGLATVYYGDIEPDHATGWKDGARAKFKTDANGDSISLEKSGAISAWAWGLSRVMDYLETDKQVDAQQVDHLESS